MSTGRSPTINGDIDRAAAKAMDGLLLAAQAAGVAPTQVGSGGR